MSNTSRCSSTLSTVTVPDCRAGALTGIAPVVRAPQIDVFGDPADAVSLVCHPMPGPGPEQINLWRPSDAARPRGRRRGAASRSWRIAAVGCSSPRLQKWRVKRRAGLSPPWYAALRFAKLATNDDDHRSERALRPLIRAREGSGPAGVEYRGGSEAGLRRRAAVGELPGLEPSAPPDSRC